MPRLLVLCAILTYTYMLPIGIGHFTILDSQNVSPEDAGNNFFLHQSSIGKSRAKESVQYLSELNDAVEAVADTSVRATPLPQLLTLIWVCTGSSGRAQEQARMADFIHRSHRTQPAR